MTMMFAAAALASCSGLSAGSNATKAKGCTAGTTLATSEAGLEQTRLCVVSGSRTHSFTVEIARTSPQQARGLMFRTELADDKGMIFPFGEPRMASFWMKNTVIPLDIIFVRADGKIENIAANTVPYSTDPVESTAPVAAVLELRGGLTAQLGIKPGDTVSWTAR
ncbi:DUF192 domain-containing protein [uncultured Sphingorhabdus sp.]|uniref:DUF192 domain-containing protein n=1 Tax=uncultured Sphingorhabdus sp. TaxID=1686106 RepID=UPI002630452B|nr:DUF192 domain-containing protein [uncultured Sphingorhabdus sp.]HMS19849.1 DUF192 domain-containing protein [Sphingorhabdus sp.]